MRDISEKIDEYSLDTYGHTNWGYLSTYEKDELKNNDHDIVDNIVSVSYTHLTLPTTPYV